jgi:hypothetical protein
MGTIVTRTFLRPPTGLATEFPGTYVVDVREGARAIRVASMPAPNGAGIFLPCIWWYSHADAPEASRQLVLVEDNVETLTIGRHIGSLDLQGYDDRWTTLHVFDEGRA